MMSNDTSNFINEISNCLITKKETIAVAESVTAGLLQNEFSLMPEATCFFQGGIVAYNIEQKSRLLNIDKHEAARSNCVSQTVAKQMATHTAALFNSSYGIAITGYAAPVPEKNIYHLHAFYAISHRQHVFKQGKLYTQKTTAKEAQTDYVYQLLQILKCCIC